MLQWNRPSRTDHYIMANTLTTEAAAGSKGARSANLDSKKINFEQRKPVDPSKCGIRVVTKEDIARMHRQSAEIRAKGLTGKFSNKRK